MCILEVNIFDNGLGSSSEVGLCQLQQDSWQSWFGLLVMTCLSVCSVITHSIRSAGLSCTIRSVFAPLRSGIYIEREREASLNLGFTVG